MSKTIDNIQRCRNEITKWTKIYAAEKVSVDEIEFSSSSIDAMLHIACENGLCDNEITEDIYKDIYVKYVEKKMEEAEKD